MKLLSLLTVAIVLIGITTQAFACYYERMSRSPNYAMITTPKKAISIPQCLRNLRRSQWQHCCYVSCEQCQTTKIRIYYYSCGKLDERLSILANMDLNVICMVIVHSQIAISTWLNITGKRVYVLSTIGKFIRSFTTVDTHSSHGSMSRSALPHYKQW